MSPAEYTGIPGSFLPEVINAHTPDTLQLAGCVIGDTRYVRTGDKVDRRVCEYGNRLNYYKGLRSFKRRPVLHTICASDVGLISRALTQALLILK